MARAFFASVPLALALVAAVIVPVVLTPGTFGFDQWPSATRDKVAEAQLPVPTPKVQVSVRGSARQAAAPDTARRVPASSKAAPARRQVALAPAPTAPHTPAPAEPAPAHGTGPGAPQSPASAPDPQTPAAPAPAPAAPAPDAGSSTAPEVAASGTQPALRGDAPDPEPAPAAPAPGPIAQILPAPVTHALPRPVRALVDGIGRPHHGEGYGHHSGHDVASDHAGD